MSDAELHAFVAEQMIVSVATTGPRGRPHLVPLWYTTDGLVLSSWTYAKSQKAKNLERDPRATLQIEDGVLYHELRGVMLECDVDVERDPTEVEKFGLALFERYAELGPDVQEMVRAQAQKRVGLAFQPTRIVSWDHTKLGGGY
jgi:PPOX class probable F420-dependent enzyme